MRTGRASPALEPRVVPTVPLRIPMLHAEDLPGDDDWALLESLRVDESFDQEGQDRYGAVMLATSAFD